MLGSRAIYHDGWKAVTFKPLGPLYSPDDDPDAPFDDDVWELFHVAEDFSECNDLADAEPEKLQELVDLWWREAERFDVLPLDNKPFLAIIDPAPSGIPHRTRYEYRRGSGRIPEEQAAEVQGRSHEVTAHVEIPDGGADGVLLAHGSVFGGYTLFVQDGKLQYVHNYVGQAGGPPGRAGAAHARRARAAVRLRRRRHLPRRACAARGRRRGRRDG